MNLVTESGSPLINLEKVTDRHSYVAVARSFWQFWSIAEHSLLRFLRPLPSKIILLCILFVKHLIKNRAGSLSPPHYIPAGNIVLRTAQNTENPQGDYSRPENNHRSPARMTEPLLFCLMILISV